MHKSSALGTKLTFLGKYYASLTNFALVASDLHESFLVTLAFSVAEPVVADSKLNWCPGVCSAPLVRLAIENV
jgi:hypothetical protein